MTSKRFKSDFFDFLVNEFNEQSLLVQEQKIDKIIKKFYENKNTKNLRIPWSIDEIRDAQNSIINLIIN